MLSPPTRARASSAVRCSPRRYALQHPPPPGGPAVAVHTLPMAALFRAQAQPSPVGAAGEEGMPRLILCVDLEAISICTMGF